MHFVGFLQLTAISSLKGVKRLVILMKIVGGYVA
jgi:hypothetical protein